MTKFKEKIIKCQEDEIDSKANEILELWIVSLLRRMKVNDDKINSILHDPRYTKRAWRLELFDNHGIDIIHSKDKVIITKHSEDSDALVLGEWKPPTVVRIIEGKDRFCELHLNYWQVV